MSKQFIKPTGTPRRLLIPAIAGVAAIGTLLAGVLAPGSADAAGTTPAAVSLTAPAAGTYGTKINLSGVLWKYNTSTKIAGAQVALQRANHGKANWGNLNYAKTSATGTFSFSVTQQAAYDYRAYYAGSTVYRAALSPVRYPIVNQGVALTSLATTNQTTGALTAAGKVTPAPPNGTKVYLEYLNGQKWVVVATGKTTSGIGRVNGARPGSVASYRIRVDPRAGLGTGLSRALALTHYVWRGGFSRGYESGSGGFTLAANDTTKSSGTVVKDNSADVAMPATGCVQASFMALRNDPSGPGKVVVSLVPANVKKSLFSTELTASKPSYSWQGSISGDLRLMELWGTDGVTTINAQTTLKLLCSN